MAKISWKSASFQLEQKREQKMVELNAACEKAIYGRFPFVIGTKTYFFSNDREAQTNFDKAAFAFDRKLLEVLPWTAYDPSDKVVRLDITKELFDRLFMTHLMYIQDNISKFRDTLVPKVMDARTEADLESIKW